MEGKRSICFLSKHNTRGNAFRLHTHDCYEMIYILSGSGTVVLGDKTYPATKDTYYVVSPHTSHTEQFDGYGEVLFVGFECEHQALIPPNGIYRADDVSMLLYMRGILDEYKQQDAEYELAARAFLDLLLVSSLRNTGRANKKCKDIEYVKAYIEQYSNQKINFAQLARLSGYSYDYFRHIFKQRFGISLQEHLIEVRLENARRLLEGTGLTCTEIAYHCGFSTSAQMSSLFKRKFGVSPVAYKKADSYKRKLKS